MWISNLGWEECSHIAIRISRMQAQLCGPGLWPQGANVCLRWAVDLIVHIFTGVHVEAGVQEGAVTQAFICVLIDDSSVEGICQCQPVWLELSDGVKHYTDFLTFHVLISNMCNVFDTSASQPHLIINMLVIILCLSSLSECLCSL